MLELKDYKRAEMVELLGDIANQAIERKLTRYGVSFSTFGNGKNRVFKITEIENRFKLFCIIELDFDPRTDFSKARDFYYHFLNDELFSAMPNNRKEEMMRSWGKPISRGTIADYIQKLADKEFMLTADHSINYDDYICYFINNGIIKKAEWNDYRNAWKEFYADLEKGKSHKEAYASMIKKYGGIGKRRFVPQQVAWFVDKLNELNDYAIEWIDKIKSEC